tara:strand:+ start:191 stop:874 length:684 start_codon:yes stop_codon:yes gene_type:complete
MFQWDDYSPILPFENIRLVFSNKSTGINNKNDLHSFVDMVGLKPDKLVTINQVHSSKVLIVNRSGFHNNADGLINKGGNLICAIKVADCLPIFFINNSTKTIGLVHAGWRGLSLGIIEEFVKKMEICDEDTSDFFILIGPSIQSCCFEIKNDVIEYFDPMFYTFIKKNKYRADLQAWAINQLIKCGFSLENITNINKCTFCMDDVYYSYRRDGSSSNRMYALAGWCY